MTEATKSRVHALSCGLILLACALAAHPVAETGINDDWSYIRTVQVLASTGHIVYNGWATAMIGWQLYVGALFVKLFGFSYTGVRASNLCIGMVTAVVMQRTFVRAGLNTFNANVGTLAVVLCPLFLPLTVTFMTDIGGLLSMVLCLYLCLRTLSASTDGRAIAWLTAAAFTNAVGGTVRQIAWVGVLLMVPSTLWLLRNRRNIVRSGVLLYVLSVAFIFLSMRWFVHQPYSLPEALVAGTINGKAIRWAAAGMVKNAINLVMFLIPILFGFLPFVFTRRRSLLSLFLLVGAAYLAFAALSRHLHPLESVLAPYTLNNFTVHGFINGTPILGDRPIVLTSITRILLTVAIGVAFACLIGFHREYRIPTSTAPSGTLSLRSLLILLGPFLLGYLALLLPRAFFFIIFDRYLLPLICFGALLLLRLYQDRLARNLPSLSLVTIALIGAFTVAETHDAFSLYRGRIQAIQQLRNAGVPANHIDGGGEYNALTQLDATNFINDPRLRVPHRAIPVPDTPLSPECQTLYRYLTPGLAPDYALSYDPTLCGGPTSFPPVTYHNWLPPHSVNLYAVKALSPVKALAPAQR